VPDTLAPPSIDALLDEAPTGPVPIATPGGNVASVAVAARVRVVRDPEDSAACVAAFTALHDPGLGRVVVHPRPGAGTVPLAQDVLAALGKDPEVLRAEGVTQRAAALAGTWLRAEATRHLVVLRADRLRRERCAELRALADQAGAVLWLVCHAPGSPAHLAEVSTGFCGIDTLSVRAKLPSSAINWEAAAAAIRADARPIPGGTGPDDEPGWGPVPSAPFPVFRAVAARQLDPDVFARLDAVYTQTLAAARAEAGRWRAHRLPERPETANRDRAALGALLQRLTVDAATSGEAMTRLRATQAGFFLEGLLLTFGRGSHRARAGRHGAFWPGPQITAHTARRLRVLGSPEAAAALALAVATNATPADLAVLPAEALAADGTGVRLATGTYRVPRRVAALVRAALIEHRQDGRGERLFTGGDDTPLSARRMHTMLEHAAARAGITAPTGAGRLTGRPAACVPQLAGAGRIVDLRRRPGPRR